MNPETRLAPGSLLGEMIAAALPAQVGSLLGLSFEDAAASAPLTLVNAPPTEAPPLLDPGVTLSQPIESGGDTFAVVAAATAQPANTPVDWESNDALFATPAPIRLSGFAIPEPTSANQASASGSSSSSSFAPDNFASSPPPPPASSSPPPGAPPPGNNPPTAPTANNDAYTVNGGSLSVPASGVLANDTNPGGQPMTATLVTFASHGMAMLSQNGSFTYSVMAGYTGTDSFTYRVNAGGAISNAATVTLTIAAAPPTANNDAYTVNGGTLSVAASGVLANDTNPGGQPMTASLVTSTAHGTVTQGSDGSFAYNANLGYAGTDSFTYQALAGGQSSNTATVALTVAVGLVGVADYYPILHDQWLQTTTDNGVLVNDSSSGGPLQAHLLSGTAHGALNLNGTGSFYYTPTAGYVGPDSFTYEALAGSSSTGAVVVTLDVTDETPSSPDFYYEVRAGQMLQNTSPGLAEVGSDADYADTLHYVLDIGPAHGQIQLADNGGFTYQPNAGFVGEDTFRYHINDGALNSPTPGIVSIAVTDTAPLAGDMSFDMAANGVLNDPTRTVLENTADTDGDLVTARLLTGPAHATLFALNTDGTFDYVPIQGFLGTDTFTFVAGDGTLDSSAATVAVNVTADALAHTHYYVYPASGTLTVSAADGLLSDAFNPTGYPISAVLVQQPSSGSVQVNADGGFVYTAAPGGPPAADVTFGFTIPLPGGGVGGAIVQAVLVVAQPTIALTTEKFTSFEKGVETGKVFTIFPDKGATNYKAEWTDAMASARNPFALVAGNKYNLVAQFSISKPELIEENLKKLVFQGSSAFLTPAINNKTPVVAFAKGILTATWNGVLSPAKASVNDTVDQNWTILWPKGPVAGVVSANTAHHQIYVLAGITPTPSGFRLFHTVARVGTLAAAGLVATTDADQISDKIMKAFETRQIPSAELTRVLVTFGGATLTIPTILKYYGTSAAANNKWFKTADLVKNGDGSCLAWGRFFMAVMRGQGISMPDTAYKGIDINPAAFDPAKFPLLGQAP